MQDTTLQVINIGVPDLEEGEELATLLIVTAMMMPVVDPQTGRPLGQVPVPDGQYRVPLQKDAVRQVAERLLEVHEQMPDPKPESNIVVPGSPADVNRIAEELGRLQ
jgi:hypothetical protein